VFPTAPGVEVQIRFAAARHPKRISYVSREPHVSWFPSSPRAVHAFAPLPPSPSIVFSVCAGAMSANQAGTPMNASGGRRPSSWWYARGLRLLWSILLRASAWRAPQKQRTDRIHLQGCRHPLSPSLQAGPGSCDGNVSCGHSGQPAVIERETQQSVFDFFARLGDRAANVAHAVLAGWSGDGLSTLRTRARRVREA